MLLCSPGLVIHVPSWQAHRPRLLVPASPARLGVPSSLSTQVRAALQSGCHRYWCWSCAQLAPASEVASGRRVTQLSAVCFRASKQCLAYIGQHLHFFGGSPKQSPESPDEGQLPAGVREPETVGCFDCNYYYILAPAVQSRVPCVPAFRWAEPADGFLCLAQADVPEVLGLHKTQEEQIGELQHRLQLRDAALDAAHAECQAALAAKVS